MDDQKPKSLDEWTKHWDERIKLAQLAVTGKTNLSILVGILPAVLLLIALTPLFSPNPISSAPGYFLVSAWAVAIATPLLLYHLGAKPNKKRAIQQLLDEIQHTCDAQGLSKAKVAEELAARSPSGSAREIGYAVAVGIALPLYNLWTKPNRKRVIQHTCDAQGLSKAKVTEELAARSPSGSVREIVIAGLDPKKAVMLEPEKAKMLKGDTYTYPWLTGKGPGVGGKFLGIMANAIFFGIMLLSAIVLLFNEFAVNTPTTLPTVGLVLGGVGWLISLLYAYTTSFDFRPDRRVPSDVLGQPFEARFSKPFASRGTVQFGCDRLRNQGNRHHKCRTQCLKGATAMTINRPAAS